MKKNKINLNKILETVFWCIAILTFVTLLVYHCFNLDTKAISYNPSIYGVEQYSINPYVKFSSWDGFFQGYKNGANVISSGDTDEVGLIYNDEYTSFTYNKSMPIRDFYQYWVFSTNGKNLAPSSVITKEMAKTTFRFTVVYNFGFGSDFTYSSDYTGEYLHDHYGVKFKTPQFFIYTEPKNYGGSPLRCTVVEQVVSYSREINCDYALSNQVTYEVKFPEHTDTIIYGMWTRCDLDISYETLQLIQRELSYGDPYTYYRCDVYDIHYGYSKLQMTQFMKDWANELDKYYGGIDEFHNNIYFTDGNGRYYTFDDFVTGDAFDEIFNNGQLYNGLSLWNQILTRLTSIQHIEFIILGALVLGIFGLYCGLRVR